MYNLDAQSDFIAVANHLSVGQYKKKCPQCQRERTKHTNDTPLSVRVDNQGVRYHCHHCEASGGWFFKDMDKNTVTVSKTEKVSRVEDFSDFSFNENGTSNKVIDDSSVTSNIDGKEYLVNRGISPDIVDKYAVTGTYSFRGSRTAAVGFPYRSQEPVAIKWRSTDQAKLFSQQNVCEQFYLIETYEEGNDLLICEGEIDALSWLSADIPENITVLSVPNGAPKTAKTGMVDPSEDRKFRYVFAAKKEIDTASRIYVNTDKDEAGEALFQELVRRIGKHKVFRIDLGKYKDASEALVSEGANVLLNAIENAEPIPMLGLHEAGEFFDPLADLYEHGGPKGASTGFASVDKLMSVPLGMMTIATGFPGSGKSDFLDMLCLNLARDHGWKTVYCSFEKPPALHMAQLAQKLTGKAFFEDTETCPRMTAEERDYATRFINDHFMFMDGSNGGPSDIDGILEAASAAVMRMGCRVLLIDPYNYITVDRSGLETDAISDMLTKIRAWARKHEAHVFFIAHPSKPDTSGGKYICGGNDVSKSAAWFAKADIGLTMWRGPDNESELHVWKARWSWIGTVGHTELAHNPDNSRWYDNACAIKASFEEVDIRSISFPEAGSPAATV